MRTILEIDADRARNTADLASAQQEIDKLAGQEGLTRGQQTHLENERARFARLSREGQELSREYGDVLLQMVEDGTLQKDSGHDPYMSALNDDPVGEPRSIKKAPTFNDPWSVVRESDGPLVRNAGPSELKARAHSAIEKMAGTTDNRREVMARFVDEPNDVDGQIATHTLISSDPHYVSAFGQMIQHGNLAQLTDAEVRAARRAKTLARAMSLTTTAGGFLVPQQLDPTIILSSDGTLNDVRRHFRQVIATGNVWNGVSTTQATWSVDAAEAAEVSDDATVFANPQVNIWKLAGFIPISIEALEDEANVTEAITRILAMGKDSLESQLFVTGTGTAQHEGLVGTAGLVAIAASIITSAAGDTFAIGDVYATDQALPARYRSGAAYFMNRATANLIRQFDTTGGSAMWTTLGQEVNDRLLGRPAYEAESMDGVITGGAENYMLLLANREAFVIADRVGMAIEPIQHLFSNTTTRPSGQRGFYSYARSGSAWVNPGGCALLNIT